MPMLFITVRWPNREPSLSGTTREETTRIHVMALVIELEEVHERVAHPLHLPIGHARSCLFLSVALGQSPSLNCRSPPPIYRNVVITQNKSYLKTKEGLFFQGGEFIEVYTLHW